jgi:Animal haem peroxidase.
MPFKHSVRTWPLVCSGNCTTVSSSVLIRWGLPRSSHLCKPRSHYHTLGEVIKCTLYLYGFLLFTSPSHFTYQFKGNIRAWFPSLVGPLYADGMTAPRISVMGTQLPLPRIVSRTVHPDEGFHDHAGTVMVVAWGQFMDHDYTLTATPLGQ